MLFSQPDYTIKCEWGLRGIEALIPVSDVLIIVDVLSFTTCVDVAVSRGALIYPYAKPDAAAYAESIGAIPAAEFNATTGYRLSPTSLLTIPAGTKLVLPSPNGSTLAAAAGDLPTFAGCLRNAQAVAHAAMQIGSRIGIVPAGERWADEHRTLRPSLEDLIGAGAIIDSLRGSRSPEAWSAAAVYRDARRKGLESLIMGCSSGKELIEKGRTADVRLASQLNASACAPRLLDGAFHPS